MRLPILRCLALASALLAGCSLSARPNRPAALVIGNGAYSRDIPALPNPEHDAETVAERLRSNGFATILLLDGSRTEMLETLQAFSRLADGAPLAVVYYSGHGIELAGRNFLLPVDFHIGTDMDAATVAAQTVSLGDVDRFVGKHAGATLLVLDACRTDPFLPADDTTGAPRLPVIVGMGTGLADEGALSSTVVYATSPGRTALDGRGEFSPFTTSVLQFINLPTTGDGSGDTFSPLLPLVRLSVMDLTNGEQTPTWRGPPIPVLQGFNVGASGPVQRIVTQAHPVPAVADVGGLPSVPVPATLARVSRCTFRSRWSGGAMDISLTTGVDGPICGGSIGPEGSTADVSDKPAHGRVILSGRVFAYAPDRDYVGEDEFTLRAHVMGGLNGIRRIRVVIRPAR